MGTYNRDREDVSHAFALTIPTPPATDGVDTGGRPPAGSGSGAVIVA